MYSRVYDTEYDDTSVYTTTYLNPFVYVADPEIIEQRENDLYNKNGWNVAEQVKRGIGLCRQQPGHACRGPTCLDRLRFFNWSRNKLLV